VYQTHFGLTEAPFGLTPNTGFYYGLPPHEEALQVLRVALTSGEGFIKVTGEVGTGKTLLLRKLLNELPDTHQAAYLPNPCLEADELRQALATELGLDIVGSNLSLTMRSTIVWWNYASKVSRSYYCWMKHKRYPIPHWKRSGCLGIWKPNPANCCK
jgi:Type II secretory pathway, component ExeA (predicted ATPase)